MTAICAGLIAACGNLGLQSPAEEDMARQQKDDSAVMNTANKHRLGKNNHPDQASGQNTSSMMKVAAPAEAQSKPEPEIDCAKIMADRQRHYFKSIENGDRVEYVRVGAVGYGAPPKNYYPEGQRRLMTMRASKVDAYRALAEVVGGLHIWGGSAIGDMVVERDRYSVFVDTYVRGARVISVSPMDDGTYKTTVEMDVDQRFLSQVMAYIDPVISRYCGGQEANGYQGSMTFAGNGFENQGMNPSFYYSE